MSSIWFIFLVSSISRLIFIMAGLMSSLVPSIIISVVFCFYFLIFLLLMIHISLLLCVHCNFLLDAHIVTSLVLLRARFFHSVFTSVELLFGLVVKLVMDHFDSVETYLSALLGMVWHSLCSLPWLHLAPLLKVAPLWSLPECVTLSSARSWGSGVRGGALFPALRELWEWFVIIALVELFFGSCCCPALWGVTPQPRRLDIWAPCADFWSSFCALLPPLIYCPLISRLLG